jgi:hypothetical protein
MEIGNMNNLQTYEEYNEGFKTKLATMALGAALSVVAPSCEDDLQKIHKIEINAVNKHEDFFDTYEINMHGIDYYVTKSKTEKVISNCYLSGKMSRKIISVDQDVEVIFIKETPFGNYLYATDDPNFYDEKATKVIINKLKIEKETADYILYRVPFTYVVFKSKGHHYPEKVKTDLGNIEVGFTKIGEYVVVMKNESSW